MTATKKEPPATRAPQKNIPVVSISASAGNTASKLKALQARRRELALQLESIEHHDLVDWLEWFFPNDQPFARKIIDRLNRGDLYLASQIEEVRTEFGL